MKGSELSLGLTVVNSGLCVSLRNRISGLLVVMNRSKDELPMLPEISGVCLPIPDEAAELGRKYE
jgi:hypothetical protein